MNWELHCARSKELFGSDGAKYHKWLDQYAKGPHDHSHRHILHNEHGIAVAVELFGEGCKLHLLQHLIDDGVDF